MPQRSQHPTFWVNLLLFYFCFDLTWSFLLPGFMFLLPFPPPTLPLPSSYILICPWMGYYPFLLFLCSLILCLFYSLSSILFLFLSFYLLSSPFPLFLISFSLSSTFVLLPPPNLLLFFFPFSFSFFPLHCDDHSSLAFPLQSFLPNSSLHFILCLQSITSYFSTLSSPSISAPCSELLLSNHQWAQSQSTTLTHTYLSILCRFVSQPGWDQKTFFYLFSIFIRTGFQWEKQMEPTLKKNKKTHSHEFWLYQCFWYADIWVCP